MKGFYSKKEAANILGVSIRQINNYMSESPPKLRRIIEGKKAYIPEEDVAAMFDRIRARVPVDLPKETESLRERVTKLEQTVEVLKLGLAFGTRKKVRTETEMLLLRQKFMDLLSRDQWNARQISQVADDLIGLRAEEIVSLYDKLGTHAWLPLHKLVERLITFVEEDPEFPGAGLDVLRERLLRAKNQFHGLIYATARSPGPSAPKAEKLLRLAETPGLIDEYVLDYILRM